MNKPLHSRPILEIILDTGCAQRKILERMDEALGHSMLAEGVEIARFTSTYEIMREITTQMHPAFLNPQRNSWTRYLFDEDGQLKQNGIERVIAKSNLHDEFCSAVNAAGERALSWQYEHPTEFEKTAEDFLNTHPNSSRDSSIAFIETLFTGTASEKEKAWADTQKQLRRDELTNDKILRRNGVDDPALAYTQALYNNRNLRRLMKFQPEFHQVRRDSGEKSVVAYFKDQDDISDRLIVVVTTDKAARFNIQQFNLHNEKHMIVTADPKSFHQACRKGIVRWSYGQMEKEAKQAIHEEKYSGRGRY